MFPVQTCSFTQSLWSKTGMAVVQPRRMVGDRMRH
jgi:hypothetical protein